MKQIVLLGVFALLVLGIMNESQAQASAKPNMFSTMAECKAALETGNLRFYEPRYFGLKTKNPADGTSTVVVPLETDLCLEMLVVGGRQFVAQREGTLFRARKLVDGSLSLYARDDCGNPVYGVIFPPPSEPETVHPSAPLVIRLPPPEDEKPELAPPPPSFKKKGKSKKKWWLIGATAVAVGGGVAYYYYYCPPGTVRRR